MPMSAVLPSDLVFAARVLRRKPRLHARRRRRRSRWRSGRTRRSSRSPSNCCSIDSTCPNAANLRLLTADRRHSLLPALPAAPRAESGPRRPAGVPRDGGQCDDRRQRRARADPRSVGKLLRRSRRAAATRTRNRAGRRHPGQRNRRRDQRQVLGARIRRSPAVLGQSIRLNDVPATIVGVNPRGFTGAASTLPSEAPDVIVALAKATLVTPASNGRNWLIDPQRRSWTSWRARNRASATAPRRPRSTPSSAAIVRATRRSMPATRCRG